MTILHALILGIVQGLTEFLPVSSSGHLIIFPKVLCWPVDSLMFDTTLHLGTALALLVYFSKDLVDIVVAVVSDVALYKNNFRAYSQKSWLGIKILLGSMPAGIVGVLFSDFFETYFRGISSVAFFVLLGTLLMFGAEVYLKTQSKNIGLLSFDLKKSVLVGLFQILPLFPGFSRSGATISGGMLLGLNREDSAKFSFLLSIPIVTAAGLFSLLKSLKTASLVGVPSVANVAPLALVVGFIASFLVGLLAVNYLLKLLKTKNLYPFILYRLLLVIFLFCITFTN